MWGVSVSACGGWWRCGARHVYHHAEMARVVTEMARPYVEGYVCGKPYGGYGYEQLRIAGLARAVQTKLCLHNCTTRYCLKNRSSCRFFFPWPRQPQQQYDEHTERVAGMRRLEEDDQYVTSHHLRTACTVSKCSI